MNTLDPTHNRGKVKIINSFATNREQVETMRKPSKGGKVKSSHARSQAQPITSTQGSTGRPQVWCTACGGVYHLRKDCHEDVFCTRCRTRSHDTEMCCVPTKTGMSNTICIYCGSTNHISSRCHNRPNDNREEPRSTPRDLGEHRTGNIYKRFRKPQVNDHQTKFNEGLNRQYLPNYNNYHQSPTTCTTSCPCLWRKVFKFIQSLGIRMPSAWFCDDWPLLQIYLLLYVNWENGGIY